MKYITVNFQGKSVSFRNSDGRFGRNVVAIHTRTCTESQQAFHVEAIGFNLNTMVATLSTFADHLKLFSRFQNRPQFILEQKSVSDEGYELKPRSDRRGFADWPMFAKIRKIAFYSCKITNEKND